MLKLYTKKRDNDHSLYKRLKNNLVLPTIDSNSIFISQPIAKSTSGAKIANTSTGSIKMNQNSQKTIGNKMEFWLSKKKQFNTSPKHKHLGRCGYIIGRLNRRTSSELPFSCEMQQGQCFQANTQKNIIQQILKLKREFGVNTESYLNYMQTLQFENKQKQKQQRQRQKQIGKKFIISKKRLFGGRSLKMDTKQPLNLVASGTKYIQYTKQKSFFTNTQSCQKNRKGNHKPKYHKYFNIKTNSICNPNNQCALQYIRQSIRGWAMDSKYQSIDI